LTSSLIASTKKRLENELSENLKIRSHAMAPIEKRPKPVNSGRPCRIVIIGANFAGLTTAISLPRNYSVDVIDRRTHFEFLPNIHELLSGTKKPDNLRVDRKRLIERAGHQFIRDTVTSIDLAKKQIYTSTRKRLAYDICVLAIGGINHNFGISGAAKFGMPFKSVENCQNIAQRLESICQPRASRESCDRGRRIGRGRGFG
jgi:NADH dehydrogenase FAD-containing subunit